MEREINDNQAPGDKRYYDEYASFTFHPHNVLLFLLLLGISALFLSLSAAFIYTRVQSQLPPLRLPLLFLFNTLLLLGSSFTMHRAKETYRKDDTPGYQHALLYTMGLSLVFMVLQTLAWRSLFQQNIFLSTDNSAAYLYVISGLHFLHVIAGLPFLVAFYHTARKQMKEPVSVLIYFSDPDKRLKLRLLSIYWHFLDGLWIYLVVFFALLSWIK